MNGILPWLKRAYFAGKKAFDEALAAYGLTATQLEVLRLVWQDEGVEQRILQERLGIASPTLTGIVDRLVDRQMLVRNSSEEDARVKLLFLTDQGRAIHTELVAIHQHAHARLLKGFSSAEIALLEQWLQRMTANIEASQDDCI